jgi:hypothetical protein
MREDSNADSSTNTQADKIFLKPMLGVRELCSRFWPPCGS